MTDSVATTTAPSAAAAEKKKPERPDEEVYKKELAKATKAHKDAQDKYDAIRAKLELAQPNKDDSPSAKRRNELRAQLKVIQEKQAGGKAGRTKLIENKKKTEEKLKDLIEEHNRARSRTQFKSVEDVDREIARLSKQVDGGMMKLVDEKRALAEISSLHKQKKNFAGYDASQKIIDDTKKQLSTIKKALDDPEAKALSEDYTKIQKELDDLKAEQDDVYKNLKSLRDQRNELQKDQQAKYLALKAVKDGYYQANRAVKQYEHEAKQRAWERKKAENEAFEREKKKEHANKLLTEASDKAYLDEIRRAESLIRYLDPSFKKENAPLQAPSQFQAQAQRTVDDTGIKGIKVVKKDEEDYFKGNGGKKGKKGRKAAAGAGDNTPPASGKYSCPPAVMEDCASMGIDPPMSAADIPSVLEKVKAKLDHWKADQENETRKNIEKAKKEVERLEAEDSAIAAERSHVNGHGHGETKATASVDEGGSVKNEVELQEAATSDVTADLKEASLEDEA